MHPPPHLHPEKMSAMERVLSAKRDHLTEALRALRRVVIAYSGGVDSTFLSAVAHEVLDSDAVAVTAVSPSLARRELQSAQQVARRFGWRHVTVPTREVEREEYARNDGNRCYWCKTELFDVIEPIARNLGAAVAVGTNTDDLGDYRPGSRAAGERGVRAPLVEADLSKADVRELSREIGLPTAEKPASPCLSSRFAYGVRVTPQGLRRVERAEEVVRSYGFEVLRVRDHGTTARIEVAPEDVPRAATLEAELRDRLVVLGYDEVDVDPEGFRSGSLNAVLDLPRITRPT